jgi:isoquinoline 1-oxidoreductase
MNQPETISSATETPIAIEPERYELHEEPAYLFELDRRDFLKAMGAGILVLFLMDQESADAQPPGGGRGRGGRGGGQPVPADIGAWLHIGEDGKITVFSGKSEMGQNIRTSLTQAVAEELRAPLGAIQLVMADTQLTPFDMGTFGSRTTPDMSRRLRRTAAAARKLLIELAAETWKVDPSTLAAADGAVVHPTTRETLDYGKLTKGRKLTRTVSDDAPMTPADHWTAAGRSTAKVDGRSFVSGKHAYASDVRLPGMLYGKMLRAPSYGATLTSLDVTAAKAMPDVVVVRDGDFVGVAAPSEFLASRALAAIKADWKPGPPISGKTLFDDLKRSGGDQAGRREATGRFESSGFGGSGQSGSIQEGLAAADVRLEQTYTVAYIAHAPLEPRAAVAQWENGKLTVWTGSSRPFGVRGELAGAFRVPENTVRVIVPDTGAGYGGKHTGQAAAEAARLAREAGRPVKLVWTREEEFTWAYLRPAGVIEIKSGARKDGTLTAWEFHNYNSGGAGLGTPYDVMHRVTAFHQANSPLKQGSYRALAATANHFARE